jgi:hypothetical protein
MESIFTHVLLSSDFAKLRVKKWTSILTTVTRTKLIGVSRMNGCESAQREI